MNAPQHSAVTDEHGTNPDIVALATAVLGFIDLDPASSPEWNRLVGASRIITREQNGLKTPWFRGGPRPDEMIADTTEWSPGKQRGTVFLNPPGNTKAKKSEHNPKRPTPRGVDKVGRFWIALAEYYRRGFVTAGIYEGYNIEQLCRLQSVGAYSHPLQHTTLIPAKRQPHRESHDVLEDSPMHACFVTLLSDDQQQIETFTILGSKLGHVSYCGRPRR